MLILWCRTDICSCKSPAKVSLMLDNPFLVPSLCQLNHMSLCFIQISTKFAYSLQGKQCFFWSHPWCFSPLGQFQHNIKISIKTARVSRLSASYDYGRNYVDFPPMEITWKKVRGNDVNFLPINISSKKYAETTHQYCLILFSNFVYLFIILAWIRYKPLIVATKIYKYWQHLF